MGERKFVNPYHFISFPKTKAPGYTDEDRHTGMIQYTITTKTPLFIPNSSSDTAFKFEEAEKVRTEKQYHKSYDFSLIQNWMKKRTMKESFMFRLFREVRCVES